MIAVQDGLCLICRGEPVGVGDQLHVDHDHATGAVRGLLCTRCNLMIGCALDRAEVLEAGAAYLRRAAVTL